MNLNEILRQSPNVPGYGGGKWAMYSVMCCWWTSFPEDLGNTKVFYETSRYSGMLESISPGHPGLPCCPHCGSVLLQAPLSEFMKDARDNPGHYGERGIEAFTMAHHRNSSMCHQDWNLYGAPDGTLEDDSDDFDDFFYKSTMKGVYDDK